MPVAGSSDNTTLALQSVCRPLPTAGHQRQIELAVGGIGRVALDGFDDHLATPQESSGLPYLAISLSSTRS